MESDSWRRIALIFWISSTELAESYFYSGGISAAAPLPQKWPEYILEFVQAIVDVFSSCFGGRGAGFSEVFIVRYPFFRIERYGGNPGLGDQNMVPL